MPRSVAGFAGFQHLLDRAQQAVGIVEHQPIKLLALRFVDFAALQGFEIKANRGDGRFQFVRDGVDEAVVLFVAADFADQEDGVEDQAGDDGDEENNAEEKQYAFAPVEDDPADVQARRRAATRQMPRTRKNAIVLRRLVIRMVSE